MFFGFFFKPMVAEKKKEQPDSQLNSHSPILGEAMCVHQENAWETQLIKGWGYLDLLRTSAISGCRIISQDHKKLQLVEMALRSHGYFNNIIHNQPSIQYIIHIIYNIINTNRILYEIVYNQLV